MVKRYIALFLLTLLFSLSLFSQESVSSLIEKGVKFHDNSEYKSAILAFEEALKLDSTSMIARYEMSLSYFYLQNYKETNRLCSEIIDSKDKDLLCKAYCLKASSLIKLKQSEYAISLLKYATNECSDNPQLNYYLGLQLYNNKRLDEALEYVKQSISLNHFDANSFLLYASILQDKGLVVESILSYQMFLFLHPEDNNSNDAFAEMLSLIGFSIPEIKRKSVKIPSLMGMKDNEELGSAVVIHNREHISSSVDSLIFDVLSKDIAKLTDNGKESVSYEMFETIIRTLFSSIENHQNRFESDMMKYLFAPFSSRLLNSKYFETYARYISAPYFEESLNWWHDNSDKVTEFVQWVKDGN